jgi:prepilin-type N-terminal cleavage/methylation domain-containing protein
MFKRFRQLKRIPIGSIYKNDSGFTLVELLITIIVLGIASTSIGGLYYTTEIIEVQSQHYDIAVRAARSEIEDLRNDGYNALTPGTTSFTSRLPLSLLPAGAAGTVIVTQPIPSLRRVDVTVAYVDYGKSETITLSSSIGIIGIGEGQ